MELKSDETDKKGVLLPRVGLSSLTSKTGFNNGAIANSLLVYNTTVNDELTEGFYYWFSTRWVRLMHHEDVEEKLIYNESMAVDVASKTLYVKDSREQIVSVPIININIDTPITDQGNGVYSYTSEHGTRTVIDVPGVVIENITTILNDDSVRNEIYNALQAQAEDLTAVGGLEILTGGEKSVFTATSIGIKDGGITTDKFKKGDDNTMLITDDNGNVTWTNINTIVHGNETNTTLIDNGDGTFTYRNEDAIKNGGAGVTFDANTMIIEGPDANGKYTFINKNGDEVIIDIPDVVISNITTILGDTNVQNEVYNTVANKGQDLTATSGLEILTGGDASVLAATSIGIKDGGITTDKLADLSVTVDKITSGDSIANSILIADGVGNAEFVSIDDILVSSITHDLKVSDALKFETGDGRNTLLGTEEVEITINEGGVKEAHIANMQVSAGKLTGGSGVNNRLAVSDAAGAITYKPLDGSLFTTKGNLVTDAEEVIKVTNGTGSLLSTATLGINDKSIKATKLNADGKPTNSVATANANGTVDYKLLTAENFATDGGKALIADSSITLSTDAAHALLKDVSIAVATDGIATSHIQDEAITTDKIKPNSVTTSGTVLISEGNTVSWKEATSLISYIAGDIITDEIIYVKDPSSSQLNFGEGAVLKDIVLGVNDKSIDIGKLKSDPADDGKILVVNNNGGFELMDRDAVTADSMDLSLNDGLDFASGTNGVGAVFVNTTIGIKNKGIDIGKLSTSGSSENDVLMVNSSGNLAYTSLNKNALEGEGAKLSSDGSLTFSTSENKVLLKPLTASINVNGVKNKHIEDKQVTAAKIGSVVADENKVLVANSNGGADFLSLADLSALAGTTFEESATLTFGGSETALLDNMTIEVKENSLLTKHIKDKQVTAAKINSGSSSNGFVLTANGGGGADFVSIGTALGNDAKNLLANEGIEVAGGINAGNGALLKEATIRIKDSGVSTAKLAANAVTTAKLAANAVTTAKLADNAVIVDKINNLAVTTAKIDNLAVTTAKISSSGASNGQVLTADGNGNVSFKAPTGGGGSTPQSHNLTANDGIEVVGGATAGNDALLKDVTIRVKDNGITNTKLANNAVTNLKIADAAVTTAKINNSAVTTDKIASNAVNNSKIADNAVSTSKIENNAVNTSKITNKAVTTDKISTSGASDGQVLTADGNGNVSFKNASGGNSGAYFSRYFYLPAIAIEFSEGPNTVDLYAEYKKQFETPRLRSNPHSALPVYNLENLNFSVTYYDDTVMKDAELSSAGVLKFKIDNNPNITGKTFINVVIEVVGL